MVRWTHLPRISFQIQIFGGDDITYQRLQSLTNMDGLLGSNVMKGDIDIYWMSVNHISERFRTLNLLCYGKLDCMLLRGRRKVRTVVTPGTI
jgi:hypothetical protein